MGQYQEILDFLKIVLAVGIIFRICLEKRQLVTETALYGDLP